MSSFKKSFKPARKTKKVLRKKSYKSKSSFTKKVLNALAKSQVLEKKHITGSLSSIYVGQVNGNIAGYSFSDITPLIGQNDGYNNRTGSKVSICSMSVRFQFWQQASVQQNVSLKYHIVYVPNNNENSLSLMMSQMFQNNPFSGIIDYNSSRNPDYMKSYKILRTGRCYLPQDSTTSTAQSIVKESRIGIKLKKPITLTYSANTNSIAQGRFMLLVFANCGNSNTSTACTLANVPITGTSTGLYYNMAYDTYYYDA